MAKYTKLSTDKNQSISENAGSSFFPHLTPACQISETPLSRSNSEILSSQNIFSISNELNLYKNSKYKSKPLSVNGTFSATDLPFICPQPKFKPEDYAAIVESSLQNLAYLSGNSEAEQVQADLQLMESLKEIPPDLTQNDFSAEKSSYALQLFADANLSAQIEFLSARLNAVEISLFDQIASKSERFFEALKAVDSLASDLDSVSGQIRKAAVFADEMQREVCLSMTTVSNNLRRLEHVREISFELKSLEALLDSVCKAEKLLSMDPLKSLIVVSRCLESYKNSHTKPLRGFSKGPVSRAEKLLLISREKICALYLEVLNPDASSFSKLGGKSFRDFYSELCRQDSLHFLISQIDSKARKVSKSGLKKAIKMVNKENPGDSDFFKAFDFYCSLCMSLIKRLVGIEKNFQETILPSNVPSDGSLAERRLEGFLGSLGRIVSGLVEYFSAKAGKLLELRTDFFEKCSECEADALLGSIAYFVDFCELNGKKPMLSLRKSADLAAGEFLSFSYRKGISELSKSVEKENWRSTEIPFRYQSLFDTPQNHQMTHLQPEETPVKLSQITISSLKNDKSRAFSLSSSSLVLLDLLENSHKLKSRHSFLANKAFGIDIDIISYYNSLLKGHVLRGKANRNRNVKKLTAYNLALAVNLVSFLLELLRDKQRFLYDKVDKFIAKELSVPLIKALSDHKKEVLGKICDVSRTVISGYIPSLGRGARGLERDRETLSYVTKELRKLKKFCVVFLGETELAFLRGVLSESLESGLGGVSKGSLEVLEKEIGRFFDNMEAIWGIERVV